MYGDSVFRCGGILGGGEWQSSPLVRSAVIKNRRWTKYSGTPASPMFEGINWISSKWRFPRPTDPWPSYLLAKPSWPVDSKSYKNATHPWVENIHITPPWVENIHRTTALCEEELNTRTHKRGHVPGGKRIGQRVDQIAAPLIVQQAQAGLQDIQRGLNEGSKSNAAWNATGWTGLPKPMTPTMAKPRTWRINGLPIARWLPRSINYQAVKPWWNVSSKMLWKLNSSWACKIVLSSPIF